MFFSNFAAVINNRKVFSERATAIYRHSICTGSLLELSVEDAPFHG